MKKYHFYKMTHESVWTKKDMEVIASNEEEAIAKAKEIYISDEFHEYISTADEDTWEVLDPQPSNNFEATEILYLQKGENNVIISTNTDDFDILDREEMINALTVNELEIMSSEEIIRQIKKKYEKYDNFRLMELYNESHSQKAYIGKEEF